MYPCSPWEGTPMFQWLFKTLSDLGCSPRMLHGHTASTPLTREGISPQEGGVSFRLYSGFSKPVLSLSFLSSSGPTGLPTIMAGRGRGVRPQGSWGFSLHCSHRPVPVPCLESSTSPFQARGGAGGRCNPLPVPLTLAPMYCPNPWGKVMLASRSEINPAYRILLCRKQGVAGGGEAVLFALGSPTVSQYYTHPYLPPSQDSQKEGHGMPCSILNGYRNLLAA